jgi:ketosteroid isomerase-like protein
MKKLLVLIFVFVVFAMTSFAQSKAAEEIENSLAAQQISWNKGDIDAFMQYYWKNDSLLFIGKIGPTYGWQNTLDNYKKGYPDKATMGSLDFKIVKIEKLSKKIYQVVGKWHLSRMKDEVGGYFTLLWKKIDGRWLIVQDHTS